MTDDEGSVQNDQNTKSNMRLNIEKLMAELRPIEPQNDPNV